MPVERISTRLVFIESGQIVNLHVIEGSIDFSPKKRATAKKAVAKKPSVRMKPETDKPVGKKSKPAAGEKVPVANIAAKKSEKRNSQNQKVDKPTSPNPPPTKSQSNSSSLRQKTLWD